VVFYAIVAAIRRCFTTCSPLHLCCVVIGWLDGRIARLNQYPSAFWSKKYGQPCRYVAFGFGSCLVMFEWAWMVWVKFDWRWCIYLPTACGALRLAPAFNTQVGIADNAIFQGLPKVLLLPQPYRWLVCVGHNNQLDPLVIICRCSRWRFARYP